MKEISVIKQDGNRTVGIFQSNEGIFVAMTYGTSKEFKTLSDAKKWLSSRGYN